MTLNLVPSPAATTSDPSASGRVLFGGATCFLLTYSPKFPQMKTSTPNWLQRLGNRSLDLLFPPSCLSCERELEQSTEASPLCSDCYEQLTEPLGPVCPRCAARVPELTGSTWSCPRCEADKVRFDATLSLGSYAGLLRDLVLRMKQDRSERVGRMFARLIEERWGDELEAMEIDAVVPIPMDPWRRIVRRVNPPEVIARRIADTHGWRHLPRLLRRRRNMLPQHGLSRAGRFRNVQGGLSISRGYHLRSPHILLVDDVLTTGATCSEAARELKKHGAERVTVLVVGRTLDD